MKLSSIEMLRRLGAGEAIASVCDAAGADRPAFDAWWQNELQARTPVLSGYRRGGPAGGVEIQRDRRGIPHIFGLTEEDVYFGFGYAMAQDRLFQLDYLRRKGTGRLSEILGPEALHRDTVVRTVGINRIAAAEWPRLPAETRLLVEAFSRGVNAVIKESRDRLPIEFDLLDYAPEPWSPGDCLAIAGELRWYLTGRLPVIVIPELAKRSLGDGPLYRAFLAGEADDESILPPGSYPARPSGPQVAGAAVSDPDEGQGSNNWVVSGRRTRTGRPMVASDPHIAFAAVSCWYEVHLSGGNVNVAGMAYAGMPAVMFGRTEGAAWGITNNICSQRDLYREKTDPEHPGCFLYDGRWEPARRITEEIKVRGAETVRKTVTFSRNGPIVDEILPPPARDTGPVSLRWVGAAYCEWLPALQRMDRAQSIADLRAAVRGWQSPTWSLVFADAGGHIGYQAVGAIPIRRVPERGYRPGWDPRHQWSGQVPFEGMPRLDDPEREWIATANNRPAPDDFPYPLSGTWSSGHRARRVRQMIEERDRLSRSDFARMHQDVLSLRAVECVPRLLRALGSVSDGRVREAAALLREWDCRMTPDSAAAAIFELFFSRWGRAVSGERFEGEAAALIAGAVSGLAATLLEEDPAGWFETGDRAASIVSAFDATLDELSDRLGPDMGAWAWGSVHRIVLRHVLSGRGDLSALLDRGGLPVGGNGVTVCNTGYDPNWGAPMGANYRLIADMSDSPPGLWAVDAQGQSGHPGSPNYCDQLEEWINGRYHCLPLDRAQLLPEARSRLTLEE